MEKFSRWLTPVIALFFATALSVTASSTIGTSISTEGDLAVTGATTLATLTASTTAVGADITLQAIDRVTANGAIIDLEATDPAAVGQDYTQIYMDPGSDELGLSTKAPSNSFLTLASYITDDSGRAQIQTGAQAGSSSYVQADIRSSAGALTTNLYIDNTTAIVDAAGSTNELTVTAGLSTFTGSVKLPTASAPPVACAGGTVAQVYFDTDINEPCYCNATAWTAMDGAGACS